MVLRMCSLDHDFLCVLAAFKLHETSAHLLSGNTLIVFKLNENIVIQNSHLMKVT